MRIESGALKVGSAFSLIETLISVVIVGLSVLGITGGINFCLATIQSNREWDRSADILTAEAERLSLLRWELLCAGNFHTNFIDYLYPVQSGTNDIGIIVSTNEAVFYTTNQMGETNVPVIPVVEMVSTNEFGTLQTNRVSDTNIIYAGTIEIKPFLESNTLGYNETMRRALISVQWLSRGKLHTNSIEINLSQNNLTSFHEDPSKDTGSVSQQDVLDTVENWKASRSGIW